MKFKQLTGILLGGAMIFTLAACNGGNPEEEKAAVAKALSLSICTNTSSGNPLLVGTTAEMVGDDNDSLTVTTSQVTNINGNKYTVAIDWSWEANKDRASLYKLDETHSKVEFVYPKKDEQALEMDIKALAKCGSQSDSVIFKVKLTPVTIEYDLMTMDELYSTQQFQGEEGMETTFKFMDTETWKIKTNHGQKYYYIGVTGKLIYKSADSNWGLLANGNKVVEAYRLDECPDNNKIKVGEYMTLYGEIGTGYGNIQLSYIKKATILTDHTSVVEPVELGNMPAGINDEKSADYKPYYCGISNGLMTVEGTLNSAVSTFSALARFTFELKVDSTHIINVAYDYHAGTPDKSNLNEVGQAYTNLLKTVTKGTTRLKVHGTVRWANDDGSHTIGGEGGWTITPYLVSDLSVVS